MLRLRTPLLLRITSRNCQNTLLRGKNTTSHDDDVEAKAYQVGKARSDSVDGAPDAGKLSARMPLVKNFFMGVVDKELLGYPEVVTREEMAKIQNELLPLKNFFNEEVDAPAIDAKRTLECTVMDTVQQLGLYGINAPKDDGGKGWGWSASLIATEPETSCVDIALNMLSHRVVIDVLKELGNEQQQQRFLSKLASGSLVGTEAIFEYNISEDDFFNTHAEYSTESDEWTLHGEKAYVVSGPLPTGATQLYLTIAQTNRLNVKGDAARGTTIFLVDGSSAGVKLGEQHLTMGCRGAQIRRVQFEKVRVPGSCIIGEPHEGNAVADTLLRASRLRNAMLGVGMAKQLVNELAQYALNNKQCGVALKDMEMTQTHLSKALCATYAMESMLYMSAGLLDEFAGQDVALEAAITKYYTLRQLTEIASNSMDMIGPKSMHAGQTTEIAFRNAVQLYTQGESMDTLRLYIALSGLQHAGALMNDTVRRSRNPLLHPGHIFGKFLQNSNIDNPKTKMQLGENVHPTLEPAAQCIEHSVARLQMCVELLLTRYGNSVIERHNEMERLTEMASTIYAMFASTARASRSYCIGLHLADHELLTASTICTHGRDLVKNLTAEVFNGQYVNNDNNMLRLAAQVAKSKGYFPVHPLTFNF